MGVEVSWWWRGGLGWYGWGESKGWGWSGILVVGIELDPAREGGGGVGVERRWLRIKGKYLVGSGLEMGVASRRDLGRF